MRQIIVSVAALGLALAMVSSANAAGQATRSMAEEYATAEDAFRDGRPDVGVQALDRAAAQGSLHAMLRLGNIYREGKQVAKNELKACELYRVAAERNARLDKFYAAAHLVAEAFRRAGTCYAKGLPVPGWEKNASLAADFYHQAGVMLDDPIALYELGKLYLTGNGPMQNATVAVRFLEAAARKRYPPAQGMLGALMWEGKVIKQRPVPGLALLILGKDAATPEDRIWIARSYEEALLTASKDLEIEALALVEKWRSVYGDPAGKTMQTPSVPMAADVPTPTRGRSKDNDAPAKLHGGQDAARYGSQPASATIVEPQPQE